MDVEGYTADKPTLMREIQEYLSSYTEDLPKIPNLSISVDSVSCDTQDDLRKIAKNSRNFEKRSPSGLDTWPNLQEDLYKFEIDDDGNYCTKE